MPKINYLIIKLDGRGNLITTKNKCLKCMKKGEFYEIPLNKGVYNRNKIGKKLEKEIKGTQDIENEI